MLQAQSNFLRHCHPQSGNRLVRHPFRFFEFYYLQAGGRFVPIAISKPYSTQRPHYYRQGEPEFESLPKLLDHYTNPPNVPLK